MISDKIDSPGPLLPSSIKEPSDKPDPSQDKAAKVAEEALHQLESEIKQISVELHQFLLKPLSQSGLDSTSIFCVVNKILLFKQRAKTTLEKSLSLNHPDLCLRLLKEIQQLAEKTKLLIDRDPFHFVVQAAASKGQALQSAMKTFKIISEKRPILLPKQGSFNEIFIEEVSALKHFLRKSNQEQENLVLQLLDIMSNKQIAVGSFHFKKVALDKMGVKISSTTQARGYSLENLSPALHKILMSKMTSGERVLLKNYEEKSLKPYLKAKAKLKTDQEQKYYLKLNDKEDWKIISLKELQHLYRKEELIPETQIGLTKEKATSFEMHLLKGSEFFLALNLDHLDPPSEQLFLSPNLSADSNRIAYEKCEQFQWSYRDNFGKLLTVDFKALHSNHLQNLEMTDIAPVVNEAQTAPTSLELSTALNVPWMASSPRIMQYGISSINPMEDIDAKPFINDMILMTDLQYSHPKMLESIMKRLTVNAELAAVYTGELQFLDMHGDNLGVAPESNEEYEKYKNSTFKLPSGSVSFQLLQQYYLEKKISLDTPIQIGCVKKTLQEWEDLQKALDVRWKFVIFDADLTVAEDNCLQALNSLEETHILPIRSVLLELKWRDAPLTDETISELLNSEIRDMNVKKFIQREDAPIYDLLKEKTKEELSKLLSPLIEKYSLYDSSKDHVAPSFSKLQSHFMLELCYSNKSAYAPIWKLIEADLSSVIIYPGDTWESLSNRHRQDIAALKKLNHRVEELEPGKRIQIHYDLTSRQPKVGKKRSKIALQLFPRLTIKQQKALLERQNHRKEYLKNYRLITQSPTREGLLDKTKEFIQAPWSPLSTLEKEDFLHLSLEKQEEEIDEVLKKCRPTYFNLMKSMHPLLADVFTLYQALYGEKAGMNIGLYSAPLEVALLEARKKFPETSPIYKLIKKIESQLPSAIIIK